MSVIWLFHHKTLISAAYAREVATPTLVGGDASVHIPYYLRRRTGSKILVDSPILTGPPGLVGDYCSRKPTSSRPKAKV